MNRYVRWIVSFCGMLWLGVALAQDDPTAVGLENVKALIALDNISDAEKLCLQYLQQYPKDVDFMVLLADIYMREQRYQEAEPLLQQVVAEYPNYTDAVDMLAVVEKKQVQAQQPNVVLAEPKTAPIKIFNPVIPENISLDSDKKNQIGLEQQSIYATSPDGYWDFTTLFYSRKTNFGAVVGALNYASRFGYEAVQGEVDTYITFGKVSYLEVVLAYADELNIFPDYVAGGELFFYLPHDYEISGGAQYKNVGATYFNTYTASVQKNIGLYSLQFRPYAYVPKAGESSVFYTGIINRAITLEDEDYGDHNVKVTLGFGKTPDLADLETIDFFVINNNYGGLDYEFPIANHQYVFDVGVFYNHQAFPSGMVRQLTGLNFMVRGLF